MHEIKFSTENFSDMAEHLLLAGDFSGADRRNFIAAQLQKFHNQIVEACYLAARGTDRLTNWNNSQMYWKGRANAASDVRALKRK